jgi:hypothetical protein
MIFTGCSSSQQEETAEPQSKLEVKKQAVVQTATLAAGTPIRVITSSEISTQTVKTGDRVSLTLNEDVTDGDIVVARRGAIVRAVISESDGRADGVAALSLTLASMELTDDSMIAIETNDHHGEATIAPETAITFNLAVPLTVDLREGRHRL